MSESAIRIGIGGWTFPPWRGVFYPDKLAQSKELEYAANRFGAIAPCHNMMPTATVAATARIV